MDDEDALKVALVRAHLLLKSQQMFWENPRNIAILLGAVAAVAGLLGFMFGRQEAPAAQFPSRITVELAPLAPADAPR